MGQQIIQQPNGRLAVFSSVVDCFTMLNMTESEIVGVFLAEQRQKLTEDVHRIVEGLQSGGKPYFQFTKSWDEAAKVHIANPGGNASAESIAEVKRISGL